MRGKPSILETLWKAYAGRAKARVFSRGERLRRRKARKKKENKRPFGAAGVPPRMPLRFCGMDIWLHWFVCVRMLVLV